MRIRLSLQQRLILAFLSISLLVLLASGAGFIYARSVDQTIITAREGIDQSQSINKLQNDWQNISELVDILFLTRRVDQTEESIQSRLSEFENQLVVWTDRAPGFQPYASESNNGLINELQQETSAAHDTIDEIIRLALEDRWAVARDMREAVLAQQQAEVNDGLQSLAGNIRRQVQASYEAAERTQFVSRSIAILATISAFILAILLGVGTTRSIVLPVKQLTMASQRVTLGDFTPFEPQQRSDEIGDLSRSFALMTEWLQDSYENLEARVAERTQELERQSLEIQVAAEIARDISSTRNTQELLDRAVELIVQRFNYYHAGIFLLDDLKQYAVLRAVSGPTGAEMLSRTHKLKVGEIGIVGNAAQTGVSRIALDVELDQSYYKNPLLPETRSEIALPIKIGSDVIGVLDVQSDISGAFKDSDLHVLQILADLLAVAIQNAELIQETEENLIELQNLYATYSREAWHKTDQMLDIKGFQYDQSGIHPLQTNLPADHENGGNSQCPAKIPLQIRDQQIGTLIVWPEKSTFSAEDIKLLDEIAIRISQSMESARLFSETQRRAHNERLVRQASTHMRETLDIESVLRTAVEDIFHTLKLSQISVDLLPTGSKPEDIRQKDVGK